MRNYNLTFIDNQTLYNHIKDTVLKYRFSMDLKQFNKNIIDPIKLTFDAKVYNKTMRELIDSEIIRQIDKSNTNHIGYFHQNMFNHIGEGWVVPIQGYDIINEEDKIYVEMKNKHNTMNSSSSQKTYARMQNTLLQDSKAKCYLVEVIAKHSQNIVWVVSMDGTQMRHENIRRVSLDKFYEIATGEAEAFKNLCEKLPMVIEDVVEDMEGETMNSTVFEELEQIDPNMLKSLYLLSFAEYEGFTNFNI